VFVVLCLASSVAIEKGENFTFTKVDLELLEQADLADAKYEKEGLVYHDQKLNEYVTRIGLSMLPAGSAPERVKWSFRILRDPMPNAFALPNGSIYVHTGLLSLLENEDQLAGVLAHEITHVTDRHTYLANRDYRKKSTAISIAQFAANMAPSGGWGSAVQLAGAMVPVILNCSIMGYRRELERDADVYAFNKLLEGDYEPREMPKAFRLLERKDEVGIPKAYYNDHPKLEDRVNYVTELIDSKAPKPVAEEVLAERRMRYLNATEGVAREDIRLAILSDRPRTALARASKLLEFHPDSPDNLYSAAEAFRALGPWASRPTDEEVSKDGEKKEEHLKRKFTAEEENRELLSRPEGQATWEENRRHAEENYQKALVADPSHARSYQGLGQLYEKEGKPAEALAAYQKYLELSPKAFDLFRIRGRIEALQRSAAPAK
jgi:predicted Zn-dependent protease